MPENQSKNNLTKEQTDIINSTGNIKINAVAGSGKTTTIIEYAAARPKESKILYLAFNRSVKLEAATKFAARNLNNVKIETAHSIAYKNIIGQYNYSIKAQGYKIHEIADLLELRNYGDKHTEYILANHINKFVTYFCNSDKSRLQELNYLDTVNDVKAKTFVRSFYKQIERGARIFLGEMDKGAIGITHDFYLKKFQLANPVLNYDYILFDEGQDGSAAMLDIFLKQEGTKVIVGDAHQQIYSWRHAVNSLAKADFEAFNLSTSFRFNQPVADLASKILSWKNHLYEFEPVSISGKGRHAEETSKATIARTNLGLLLNAINFITENRNTRGIYFEGNINSYTYADDGASLYDVLHLYNHNHNRIRDKLIKSMRDLDELKEYIEKTDDVQLTIMVEIVKEYGNEIPGILRSLKALHVGDKEREKAEMIFSTVHRAKGMEYDVVHLVNDYVEEKKLEKLKKDKKEGGAQPIDITKWNEEINLLYVAITRTRNKLFIHEELLPDKFPSYPNIHVIRSEPGFTETGFEERLPVFDKDRSARKNSKKEIKKGAYSIGERRKIKKDAYKPWTPELDAELRILYDSDNSVSIIAEHFGRTKGAIISRLKKMNCYIE